MMTTSIDEGHDDPKYNSPLHHRRAFGGAGIKRKRRVEFVPQSLESPSIFQEPKEPAGDLYLSIVMPKSKTITPVHLNPEKATIAEDRNTIPGSNTTSILPETSTTVCPICQLPTSSSTTTAHASTLAHQICLPHTHPPSAIDRSRKGLTMMSSHGFDPDARTGLGAQGAGRLHPVLPKIKDGKAGVGGDEVVRAAQAEEERRRRKDQRVQVGRRERICRERDAKGMDERLRSLLFGREDVNRYLGVEL